MAEVIIFKTFHKQTVHALIMLFLTLLLSSCSPEIVTEKEIETAPTLHATASISPTFTALPTATLTLIPSPTSFPPSGFTSDILREEISAQSYIADECQYLAMRWDADNALPGTIVAPIMFHSIRPAGEEINDPSFIDEDTFNQIIDLAEFFGFETITSEELIGFLYENKRIPQRSMMLIIDDRRPGTAEKYFQPIMKDNNWTTTLSWIVGDTDQELWEWIERLSESSYFDIQAHGFNHIYLQEDTSEEDVREELSALLPVFKEHFGIRPEVYIWPGGNYTETGINIAREVGYQLGFTIHSRGPIQFNWVPQGEQEISLGDPLMTLPRFWSSAAIFNLDQAVKISEIAIEFSIQNYPLEAAWYSDNCAGELASLEAIVSARDD